MTERRARRRPGENRERLIEAGLTEFGLSGYHGTTTGRIAARAGVPQPHVYANFRTKQELFLACLESVLSAPSPITPAVVFSDQAARMLFQAVAGATVAELRAPISTQLTELRHAIGEPGFAALLAQGAATLLTDSSTGG